jgi:hypothetical protein
MKTMLSVAVPTVLALVLSGTATASTILFDFNSLGADINSVSNGSPFPSSTDPIEDYMEDIYGSNITVQLGARTRSDRVEGRPNGSLDMYLANSDGASDRGDCPSNTACHGAPMDTFLINRWNASSIDPGLRDRIIITFEDDPIMGFEVDWEIFPVTRNGQNADITIKADGEQLFFSQLLNGEKERGDLGHFVSVTFLDPVHTLEFIDWNDAPIGIDNLRVTRRVPVPGTPSLLGAGLLAFGLSRKRSRARKPREAPKTSNGADLFVARRDRISPSA